MSDLNFESTEIDKKASKGIGRKGIMVIIPLFLLLCGTFIIAFSGWKLFKQTYLVGKVLFNKPSVELSEKKFLINNKLMERPKLGTIIGKISIPSINLDYPMVHGDSDEDLEKGIGHFAGSTLPGENGNVVLDSHRDTHFRNLGKAKIGDTISLETYYGIFDYKISNTRIVNEDDRTVIVASDKEMLTIYTCYPFNYIGHAPQRYVVVADFVGVREGK